MRCLYFFSMEEFYNTQLVEREHKYKCSRFRNKQSVSKYTPIYSRKENYLKIELTGHKSGLRSVNTGFEVYDEYDFQPSHLEIILLVKSALLTQDVNTYPCLHYSHHSFMDDRNDLQRFLIHDIDAFLYIIRNLSVNYECITPMIVQMYTDWINIDTMREKRASDKIKRMLLQYMYSPKRTFFKTQVVSDLWKSYMTNSLSTSTRTFESI